MCEELTLEEDMDVLQDGLRMNEWMNEYILQKILGNLK